MGAVRSGLAHRLPAVAAAGALGWLADAAVLWLAAQVLGVPVALAAAVGFVVGGVVNFVVNRMVFANGSGRITTQGVRYAFLFAVNLGLTTVLVPALAALLESAGVLVAPLLVAKVVVTAALVPVNALAYHVWVFPSLAPVPPREEVR